jgi:hypothetical protein
MSAPQPNIHNNGVNPMPFPQNAPSVDDLLNLPLPEIALLSPDLLAAMQREISAASKQMKTVAARFNAALEVRYAARAAEERRVSGKDAGTVRFEDGDCTIVADLSKRVDWNQAALSSMVARIIEAGDDPAQYVDIAYKVSERKYGAWPDAIREGFEPARTVRTGTLSVTLIPAEEQQ